MTIKTRAPSLYNHERSYTEVVPGLEGAKKYAKAGMWPSVEDLFSDLYIVSKRERTSLAWPDNGWGEGELKTDITLKRLTSWHIAQVVGGRGYTDTMPIYYYNNHFYTDSARLN